MIFINFYAFLVFKKIFKKIIFDVKNSIFEEKKISEISIISIGQRDDDDKSWELQLWECV